MENIYTKFRCTKDSSEYEIAARFNLPVDFDHRNVVDFVIPTKSAYDELMGALDSAGLLDGPSD
jgi:hypothetical protein